MAEIFISCARRAAAQALRAAGHRGDFIQPVGEGEFECR